jgi:RING finger/CHY zinc finger protein 1
MNEIYLREEIKKIRDNSELSSTQKNKNILQLMNKYTFKKTNNCEHYPLKKCNNFFFSCCGKFAECIRCHNEMDDTHKVILQYVTCKKCKLLQKPNEKCSNCNLKFSKNYCNICNIWTDKDSYHCNKCGLCRIGNILESIHCDKCDTCYNFSSYNLHKCSNISSRDKICGFCLEDTYNSQISSMILSCNHIVHKKCYNSAYENDEYRCPTCRKSIFKVDWSMLKFMINYQAMPKDEIKENDIVYIKGYKNSDFRVTNIDNDMISGYFVKTKYMYGIFHKNSLIKPIKMVDIICNDCESKSNVIYHYLGNECVNCGSFNTNE